MMESPAGISDVYGVMDEALRELETRARQQDSVADFGRLALARLTAEISQAALIRFELGEWR